MAETLHTFKLIYISIAPDGTITRLTSMTDKKYKALADKNGIYKALYIKKPSYGTPPKIDVSDMFHDIYSYRKILEEEKKLWEKSKRNVFLWLFSDGGTDYLSFNYMAYLGLKDPNIKVDANCPHPESSENMVIKKVDSGGDLKLIATDGSEILYENYEGDEYRSGCVALDKNKSFVGDTPINVANEKSYSFAQVYKKTDNTIYPVGKTDNSFMVGARVFFAQPKDTKTTTIKIGIDDGMKFNKDLPFAQFLERDNVKNIDDVINDGEFCSFGIDSSYITNGSIWKSVQNYIAYSKIHTRGIDSDISITTKLSESNTNNKSPKFRLLSFKDNNFSAIDTNVNMDIKLGSGRYVTYHGFIANKLLDLNNGKVAITYLSSGRKTTLSIFVKINGKIMNATKTEGSILDTAISKLKITDKTDVSIEKYMNPVSRYDIIHSFTSGELVDSSNFQSFENDIVITFQNAYSFKLYAWK